MATSDLSMAGHARAATEMTKAGRMMYVLMRRYPDQASLPGLEEVCTFRAAPTMISVLDYSKGFEHINLASDPGDREMAFNIVERPIRSPSQPVTRPCGPRCPPDKKGSKGRDAQTRDVGMRDPLDEGSCMDPIQF